MTDIKARFILKKKDFVLDVNLETKLQGVTGIFGPIGAGKSLLLRSISGLEQKVDKAQLVIGEEVLHDTENKIFVPPHERDIGYIFQDLHLFTHMNVRDNLLYGLKRVSGEGEIDYEHVVKFLKLENLLDQQNVNNLSGGEKQKIAIARTLLSNPRLLLIDESMSSLDKENRLMILNYIKSFSKEFSIPAICVTHYPEELEKIANQVINMKDGSII